MYRDPRSILITGASSGIGEALALHYARAGVTLCLTGRDEGRLRAVALRCEERGAALMTWIGDVTDADGLRAWIFECDRVSPLNLVIANAGVALGASEVEGLHKAAIDSYAANVTGVFNTVHPALEAMSRRRPYPVTNGQVAIMSSIMGYVGMARSPAYSSSKATVKHYGQALRGAFRGMGIGVSVICPGYVASRITDENKSAMPFLVAADEAARIIARGLEKNKPRITFPWQVMVIARIAMNLPGAVADWLNRPWGVPRLEDVPENVTKPCPSAHSAVSREAE